MEVSRKFQVPYLGGASKDGETIYIDMRFPTSYLQRDGKIVHPIPYLVRHEVYESQLMKQGIEFNTAHRLSAQHEKEQLRHSRIDVKQYYENIYKWVMDTIHQIDAKKLPPDLNLQPYIGDGLETVLRQMGLPSEHFKHPHSATPQFLKKEMLKDIKE